MPPNFAGYLDSFMQKSPNARKGIPALCRLAYPFPFFIFLQPVAPCPFPLRPPYRFSPSCVDHS
ncbi:MAG: hypothetical protein KatS3mg099_327 [Candidatus Parcubacteria bacterium]|nr:MAG: hypothetical protein KatS3mg099_327 [Candidatus Parcubacteria bacterium]